MAAEYQLGQTIEDPRYTGKSFLGHNIEKMPYSPNRGWIAPVYHPFKLEELVAVHLTDQDARATGELKPHSYYPFQFKDIVTIDPDNSWLHPRETLHFALNGVVPDHNLGGMSRSVYSVRDGKFAYLIPLKSIYDQVISVFTHDTIVLGRITLPDNTVVIENQTADQILKTISTIDYQPLDIQGVQELDPAYLLGTRTNVNHPINFASMINDLVDSPYPYTWDSTNDIIVLDHLLLNIVEFVATGRSRTNFSLEFMEGIDRRMNFIAERYKDDKKRAEPVSRLQRMTALFTSCLSETLACRESFVEALRNAEDRTNGGYTEIENKYRERQTAIAKILAWREIPE